MLSHNRLQLALWHAVGAAWLLAACQSAPLPAVPVTRVTTPASPTAIVTATTVPSPLASATSAAVEATATARPSDTPVGTPGASPTRALTGTPLPVTLTSAPTATGAAAATVTATVAATSTRGHVTTPAPATAAIARASVTPMATNAPPVLYSTTGGPAGYSSRIQCQQAGGACAPRMAPGDLSFQLSLASDPGAPWTHFVNYGLSVEKDGANVAAMFMFVDAGWLQPGAVVGFGASRNFAQPGTYVIRSSGCMTTDQKSNDCVWQTIAGTVVTFVMQ